MLTIGVLAAEHIAVGLVNHHQLVGSLRVFPPVDSDSDFLIELPNDEIARRIAEQIEAVADGQEIAAIGLGFPGIIRDGLIEDSPNLPQMKGQHLAQQLSALLSPRGITADRKSVV